MTRRSIGLFIATSATALIAAARPPAGAIVTLTTQPGSALELTAAQLVSRDLAESRKAGDTPVLLVGSAHLAGPHAPAALFVQVQSAAYCGSAGCTTELFLKRNGSWRRVLDSISGQIRVSPSQHGGMHDLLVHGRDRFVWNGHAYADTLPTPPITLK